MSEIKTNKISPRKGTTQTIGDSGDTVTVSSGANICNAGTLNVSNLTNSGTITSTGTLTTAGISGGTINNTTGTISGVSGILDWDTTAKTTGFTAVAGNGYFVNTTSGEITVTLPASPSAGDQIGLKDYANTFDTNKLTISRNGSNIQGRASDFECTDEGAALQFIYVDATRGWVLTDASKASDIAENLIVATGGTITTCGDYKIHTFTGPGTFCVSAGSGAVVDYIVVAGGGGGGTGRGGGGGAGGYRESSGTASGCYTASPLGSCVSALPVSITAYPITVGSGGTAGTPSPSLSTSGSNSVFSTITSAGGGGGGQGYPGRGLSGGSGGGNDIWISGAGQGNTPPVSPPQGNPGGEGVNWPTPGFGPSGGGGAGAAGTDRLAGGATPGGAGVSSSINGTPTARAGGAGGGGCSGAGGLGGTGGGGNGRGGPNCSPTAGTAGTANTGGGGGGGFRHGVSGTTFSGYAGGSGIVIIRYKYQ